ncbi:MAG: hypothetical protein ACXAAI_10385 [Promethearchaeota archaeon]
MLYFDSLKEIKRTIINTMTLQDLKEFLEQKRVDMPGFIKLLRENNFSSRTIYEITKY